MFNNKVVLITGGTGSFGKTCTKLILKKYPKIKKLIIFSRDELKQFEMAQVYSPAKYECIRFFIGDVRDKDRLLRAFHSVDVVIHAAALKQVPSAEYNPMECIKTNIMGAENVINAAIDSRVKKVIALSTDKAAAPINLYGATKLCSDKLFVAANNLSGEDGTIFSVVRYGNVLGSRGSVVPFFLKERMSGTLSITHKNMTRFNLTLEQGVEMVLYAVANAWGGEIFIPKIPSFKILDLAQAIGPNCKIKYVGIRPGEKLHEDMITETDSLNTLEFEKYYVIVPATPKWEPEELASYFNGNWVKDGFRYNSSTNDRWLSVKELEEEIRKNVDPNFKPV
ncbi:UDP-N-acetylglucosamine 4,6-dehydratase (inverting) [Candidatus Riflebacteria bacterium]